MCIRDRQIGGLGFGGLNLSNLMSARAAKPAGVTRDTSVVWLWLNGGPTHIETFDPKMTAPKEYRSVSGEVKTRLPGVTLGGHFKGMADLADKMTFVRSFQVPSSGHNVAAFWVNTGYGPRNRPSLGSITSRVRGPNPPHTGMPTYVKMGQIGFNSDAPIIPGSAWLGKAYSPFTPSGPSRDNMNLTTQVSRLEDRRSLLKGLDDLGLSGLSVRLALRVRFQIPLAEEQLDLVGEKVLSNPAIEEFLEANPDPELELCMKWSHHVNRDVKRFVNNVPPFPNLRECLEKFSEAADMMVVSATPVEALTKEWKEHDIDRYVGLIAGQEMGNKKEHLEAVVSNYEAGKVLMIGDAPGDQKAAKANNALFFPIVPGEEEASWEHLLAEGIDRFLTGSFSGDYEAGLTERFLAKLPSDPPWNQE